MAELLHNRSLANVSHRGCTSRLKWNLDSAGPTENVSLGDGSDWGNEIHCFCEGGNEMCFPLVL